MKKYIPQANGTMKEIDVPKKIVVQVNETVPIGSGQVVVVPGKSGAPLVKKPIEPKPIVTPPPTAPVEPKPILMQAVKPTREVKKAPVKEVKKAAKKGK